MKPSNHEYIINSVKATLIQAQSALETSLSDMRGWLCHNGKSADWKAQSEIASTAEDVVWNIEQATILLERVQTLSVRLKAEPETKYWVFDEHNNITRVTEAEAAAAQGLTVEEMRKQDAEEWETERYHKLLLDAREYEADMTLTESEHDDETDESSDAR